MRGTLAQPPGSFLANSVPKCRIFPLGSKPLLPAACSDGRMGGYLCPTFGALAPPWDDLGGVWITVSKAGRCLGPQNVVAAESFQCTEAGGCCSSSQVVTCSSSSSRAFANPHHHFPCPWSPLLMVSMAAVCPTCNELPQILGRAALPLQGEQVETCPSSRFPETDEETFLCPQCRQRCQSWDTAPAPRQGEHMAGAMAEPGGDAPALELWGGGQSLCPVGQLDVPAHQRL